MSDDGVDLNRRHFLTVATTVTGVVGAAAASWPFIASMRPSARAQALGASVEVDISKLEPGAQMSVMWRGKAGYIVQRPQAAVDALASLDSQLRDPLSDEDQQPGYAKNAHRSIRPEILVVEGVCTHLGCAPEYRPDVAPADLGPAWKGGFFCPCHGSKFDLAGRVFQGVPAPTNLAVPPYRFLTNSILLIGDDTGAAA